MEKLMTINEYIADKPYLTYSKVRKWLLQGMKHVGKSPKLFKESWAEEYIEQEANTQVKEIETYSPTIVNTRLKQMPKFNKEMKISLDDL